MSLLASYSDAIVTTALGLWLYLYCHRHKKEVESSPDKMAKWVANLSPFVLAFGIYQFFLPVDPPPEWRWVETVDGVASAEFPMDPEIQEAFDEFNGERIRRISHSVTMQAGKIELRLMYNPYAMGAGDLPNETRLEELRELFAAEGFRVLEDRPVAGSFRDILLEASDGKLRVANRIYLAEEGLYAVVATSGHRYHEDERIRRFLSSFRTNPQPGKPVPRPKGVEPAPVPVPSFE